MYLRFIGYSRDCLYIYKTLCNGGIMTLKQLRIKNLLSVRELSEKSGIPEVTIWRWERGEYKPNMASLRKLVAVLGEEAFDCLD